jgi:hypothetical protein
MPDDGDELGDARSREALRKHRQGFNQADPRSRPDTLYLHRWIPTGPRAPNGFDGFLTVLGAVLLAIAVIAVVAGHFLGWKPD